MTRPWMTLLVLSGLITMVGQQHMAFARDKCPISAQDMAQSMDSSDLALAMKDRWPSTATLFQWLGFAVSEGARGTTPRSQARTCLRELDRAFRKMAAEAQGMGAAYTAGFMGTPPPDVPDWATDRDNLDAMFDRVLTGLPKDGGTSFVGTWKLVGTQLFWNELNDPLRGDLGMVVEMRPDGRMMLYTPPDFWGDKQEKRQYGAWFVSPDGDTLSWNLEGEAREDSPIMERGPGRFVIRFKERMFDGARSYLDMEFQRVGG